MPSGIWRRSSGHPVCIMLITIAMSVSSFVAGCLQFQQTFFRHCDVNCHVDKFNISPNLCLGKCPFFSVPGTHFEVMGILRFMSGINQQSLPIPFLFCYCIYFCLYVPFNCISFQKFSRPLSAFLLCSSGLISALLALSTIYLFMKVSFSPDIIPSG